MTQAEFAHFVAKNPEWSPQKIKRIFADENYLKNRSEFRANAPVTEVSWFAARAYCQSEGADLPTTDQWEYVAYDHGRGKREGKDWYSHPARDRIPEITRAAKNGFGVYGLYDLIWEWTLDFNGSTTDDAEQSNFCGAAGQAAKDSTDYASFMRYSFRSSLQANFTVGNLGFRCAKEIGKN